jgi:hypothetical protein
MTPNTPIEEIYMGSLDPIHNSIQWRGCVVRVIRSLPLQEDEVHGAAVALCTGQDGHRGQRERERVTRQRV